MELKNILSKCDHTLLLQGSTWSEIQAICDDGIKYGRTVTSGNHCAILQQQPHQGAITDAQS